MSSNKPHENCVLNPDGVTWMLHDVPYIFHCYSEQMCKMEAHLHWLASNIPYADWLKQRAGEMELKRLLDAGNL